MGSYSPVISSTSMKPTADTAISAIGNSSADVSTSGQKTVVTSMSKPNSALRTMNVSKTLDKIQKQALLNASQPKE